MVATRRGVRTDPAEEPEITDASLTLRKKPVRRATAATAATAAKSTQAAPKTRATRSKKAVHDQEDELAVPQQAEVPEAPEPTKRTTRSKRADTVEAEPSRSARLAKPVPQPKHTTKAAPTQSNAVVQESQAAPTVTKKPALAARPARQARAKTPATQAPLSPKKITQVSRTRTRGAKITEEEKGKPTPNTRPTSAAQTSRASRKRAVSDENAEIPEPVRNSSPFRNSPVREKAVEEEEQLSGGTTLSKASEEVFEPREDYDQIEHNAASLDQGDRGQETIEQSASDDELCGPKTPMRRTRKAQAQSHISTRSNARRRDPDVPLHTPPRRHGTRGRAPQTQKPCDQGATSEPVARPMNVARADDLPFVFRKLEETTTPILKAPNASDTEDDEIDFAETAPEKLEEHVSAEEEDVDLAESGDGVLESADDGDEKDPDETIVLGEDCSTGRLGSEVADSMVIELPEFSYEPAESRVHVESSVIEPPMLEESAEDIDSSHIEPSTAEYEDQDDMDVDSPTVAPPVASYEVDLDGSVIIHSRNDSESGDDSEVDEANFTNFGLKTPRPETIPWQNIREDTTIPIDFDLHFADVRSPARVNDEFSYAAASGFQDLRLGEANVSIGFDQDLDHFAENQTINLDDFVDMAALTEPTLQLNTVADAIQDDLQEACNDESTSGHMDDTESTVIITEINFPLYSTSKEVKVQDNARDHTGSSDMLRSGMMRESLQELASIDHPTGTVPDISSPDVTDIFEEVDGELVPHYALPTLSSRRKSLPAPGHHTPVRSSVRPVTSDGPSISRAAHPFDRSFWARSRRSSLVGEGTTVTPTRGAGGGRMSTAKTSVADNEEHSHSDVRTPVTQSGERFSRRTPRDRYDAHFEAQTVAAPSRFRTPTQAPVRRPATVQKLTSQQNQHPCVDETVASSPKSVQKSWQDGGDAQAKSFEMPFRARTPASSPAKTTPARQEGAIEDYSARTASRATPQERFPRRSARQTYDQQSKTVAPPARFHTPIQGKPRRPATVQKLASQLASKAPPAHRATPSHTPRGSRSQDTSSTVTPSDDAQQARFPKLPPKEAYEAHIDAETRPLPATPQARFPRLPSKQTYDERASTVIAPSRFRSPIHAGPRRPATSQKPVNLRKVALKSAAPGGSHTPIKTPLKAPAETPAQVPMTPHPGAPLRGVLALVEVFTLDGASASAPFISLLQRLGAKTTKTWSERVTHVIFKDGSPTTLQRVRLNNKQVETSGKGFTIHCVNSRWVSDCDASGSRVDEDDDAYAVDVTEVPRGGSRRRKSMEPSALVNIGGNIVRDRKSIGRQSIGRSTMKPDPMEKKLENDIEFTPVAKWQSLPLDDDFEDDESELMTPDYLAAPDKLVQMTAPINRVRKLDLQKDASKNRRMTSFWEGGEE
jgi:hypothetical protein